MAVSKPTDMEVDRMMATSARLLCETVKFDFTQETVQSLRNVQPRETPGKKKVISVDERGIPLGEGDIQRMVLAENGWLNDEMINRAMNFLNKKHPLQRQNGKTVSWGVWRAKTLQSFWFTNIKNGNVSRGWMTNWMKDHGMIKGKQPRLDCIIIPCHHLARKHWTLILVFPLAHKIAILDSLAQGATAVEAATVYGRISRWLHAHMEDDFDEKEWTLIQLACPQQENSADCGIHVALNAWFLSKGICPMAHKDMTPRDRRLFVAHMVTEGTKDSPVVMKKVL